MEGSPCAQRGPMRMRYSIRDLIVLIIMAALAANAARLWLSLRTIEVELASDVLETEQHEQELLMADRTVDRVGPTDLATGIYDRYMASQRGLLAGGERLVQCLQDLAHPSAEDVE